MLLEQELWEAASRKDLETVKKILKAKGTDLNWKDPREGRSPFYRACGFAGDPSVVREFLGHPSLDPQSETFGERFPSPRCFLSRTF